jgi:hypothetical protein
LDIVVQAVQRAAFQNEGLLYAMVRLPLSAAWEGNAAAALTGSKHRSPLQKKLGKRNFESPGISIDPLHWNRGQRVPHKETTDTPGKSLFKRL